MKLKLILLIAVTTLLLSCGLHNDPSWTMQENPLDSYEVEWHSPAWGTFGPHGKEYPYRPDMYGQPKFNKTWDTYSPAESLRH